MIWEKTEKVLDNPKSDILLIFDCCQAGVLARRLPSNRFQVLGACTENEVTRPPGKESFTMALIWALEQLKCRDHFFVNELRMEIRKAPDFPETQIPVLVDRDHASPGHIVIAPLHENSRELVAQSPNNGNHDLRGEFINLRFHFEHEIKDMEFVDIAKAINELLQDKVINASRVAFLGKRSYRNDISEITKHWRGKTGRRGGNDFHSTERPSGDHLTIDTNVQTQLLSSPVSLSETSGVRSDTGETLLPQSPRHSLRPRSLRRPRRKGRKAGKISQA